MIQSHLRRWDAVASYAKQVNAQTIVEVGCKEGRTTSFLLANLPDVHVTAIDPWAPLPNQAEDYSDHDFGKIEREFWDKVKDHRDRLTMMRTTSLDAATQFADGSVDVVFIDAGHDEPNCSADIDAWWPKVKVGGVLCGHDYQQKFPGVMRAVASHFPLMQVGLGPDSVWFVFRFAEEVAA